MLLPWPGNVVIFDGIINMIHGMALVMIYSQGSRESGKSNLNYIIAKTNPQCRNCNLNNVSMVSWLVGSVR